MINGIEITMEDGAHLIIYNPHENIRNLYDKKCNYSVLLNYLKINKGVLCIPHPFRDNSGILSKKLTSQHQDIIKLTQMIEVIDGKRSYSIDQKEKITTIFAKNQIKLPILVSSTDAHEPINLITSFSYANSIEVGEKKIVFDKIINFHLSDYENGIIARKKDIVLSGIIKLFAIPPMVKILSYIKYQFRYYRNRVSKSDVRFRYSAVQ